MVGARVRRTGQEIDRLRMLRIAHVDDGDAVAEAMADIGEAAMHHDLHAVAAAALVAVADELDVAGCNGVHGSISWKRLLDAARADQPTAPTRSRRPNASPATQLAVSNSAASRSVAPSSCRPSGRPSSSSSGSVSAGQPSSDAATFMAVFPVVPSPTGAAPHAP